MEEEGGTFCVRCGRSDRPMIGAVCVACFGERTALASLPDYLDVVLCPTCGSREVRNHWEKARGGDPAELRKNDVDPYVEVTPPAELVKVRWTASGQNPRVREVAATITVRVEGSEVEVPARSEVHLIYRSCPECSRRGGNYYTARVQLRAAEEGSPRGPRDFKPWAAKMWSEHLRHCSTVQQESITREEELKEGWDVFFADTAAARSVARSFKARTGASAKETASLWGMRHGREIHRITFLVRLPPVGLGDLLEEGGHLWEVASVAPKGQVELLDVQEGSRRPAGPSDLARMRFVCGPEGRRSAPVRFPDHGAPFVRDPTSGKPIPFAGRLPPSRDRSPEGAEPDGNPELPVVLGSREAWWAPHRARRSSAARSTREDSIKTASSMAQGERGDVEDLPPQEARRREPGRDASPGPGVDALGG